MKLLPPIPEHTTILIKGRVTTTTEGRVTKPTCRSFQVTGNDVEYKTECIIKAVYKNTRLDDPFGKTKLHVFSIYVNQKKMSTATHLSLDEYCKYLKEYIEFERWNDVL
jgi:hypothetical protein